MNSYREYYPYLKGFDRARALAELAIRRRQSRSKIENMREMTSHGAIRLLGVGSGPGYFVSHAIDAGIDAVAGEINADAVSFGEKNFAIRFVDITQSQPESFDVVTVFQVLEHVEYPISFLRTCLSSLKPGGLAYIHVPVADPIWTRVHRRIKSLLQQPTERRGSLYAPDHLTGFSEEGIPRLLQHVGAHAQSIGKLGMLSAEYDPFFWRFRAHDVKQWPFMGVEIVSGGIDIINGGAWLRVLAIKS